MKRETAVAAGLVMLCCTLAGISVSAEEFRTFRDGNFGFSFQLPSTWNFRVTESKDYLFKGPADTAEGEATIVVQIVMKSANPGSSHLDQLKDLWNQLSTVPAAAVESDGMVPMAGGEFPFFIAGYRTRDSKGEERPYGHLQVVIDNGDFYYPLSYSAPKPAFDEYLKVFKHMSATFTFE